MGIVSTGLPILGTTPRGDGEGLERNALSALLAEFNGNVDAANCKAAFAKDNVEPAFSTWKRIVAGGRKHLATGAGTFWYGHSQGSGVADSEGDYGAPNAPLRAGISLVPADLQAAARALKLRLKVTYMINQVAPGVNFTWSLKSTTPNYGASGSGSGLAFGADVPSSPLVLNTPGASSGPTVIAQEFTAPAQGVYVITFAPSAGMAAGSCINLVFELEYRQV
jgi:hypothetical protein